MVVVDKDGTLAVGVVTGMMWRQEVVIDKGGAVVRLPSSS